MHLTENHKHVGSDGQVYLPILHEWNASRGDNLIELVVSMASVFSNAPPVFTRDTPPPPPPPAFDALEDDEGQEMSLSTREAILAAEAYEANAAAEAARKADLAEQQRREEQRRQEAEEQRRKEAVIAQQQWEQTQTNRVRQDVVQKIKAYLTDASREVQAQVQSDWRDQQRLDHAAQFKIDQQMKDLTQKKQELKKQCEIVEKSVDDIQKWINEAEQSQEDKKPLSADEMVVASSPLHAQMMELSAENWAISDALYFLDKALYQGHLDCLTHQKQVRSLAKKQFLVRAHLIKINGT
jgi:ESCRT-I complex subunit TSG101